MTYQETYGGGEPGGRRKKLAGYLKAANDLRQTYQQQYAPGWSRREAAYDQEDQTPGGFQDAAIVRSGDEEMVLFPSYARKHIRQKPEVESGTIQEVSGDGRDVRDSAGAGDAEFWKQQWDNYEDDNAVVDVDVRGWIYSPHKGQMTRKQRLFIGLARQLVGIQAPPAGAKPSSSSTSPLSSREPSPGHMGHRERKQIREAQRDEQITAQEAEEILRRGEKEAELAAKGAYSEQPTAEDDNDGLYHTESRDSVRSTDSRGSLQPPSLTHASSNSSLRSNNKATSIQKRATWNQPADMSAAELAEANARLMARLQHFLAIPMANTPISIFFYNNEISKSRTVYTNPSGHFSISAALDFVPTHVRILASEQLSATEEVRITDPHGISVISDIDDTIKHSAISSGAREIFRNAFIRELGDLTIEGVREWYNRMAEMGVTFHYVSNSPWQLYPVISKYFEMAGLPPGSFHLKQYSGMLQGIFEPVAERKKGTLDKIARDFPERRFILVGDSGEADLEVYTDFVIENPGRVVAVFIRDVTTSEGGGFFDHSVGPMSGDRTPSSHRGSTNTPSRQASSSYQEEEDDDPELKAAIAASLREMEEEERRRSEPLMNNDHPTARPQLPARKTTQPRQEPVVNLIDLTPDDESKDLPALRRVNTDTKGAPPLPKKPTALRSGSGGSLETTTSPTENPPPKPRRPSSNFHQTNTSLGHSTYASSPLSRPQLPSKPSNLSQQSYTGMARDKLTSIYNNLPSTSSYQNSTNQPSQEPETKRDSNNSTASSASDKRAPPPPPPRRGITSYPAAAASFVGTKAASAWQHAPNMPHPGVRPSMGNSNAARASSYTTTTSNQYPDPTNPSAAPLGMNGGGANGNGYNDAGLNKREMLWWQRWARAEHVLRDQNIVLKTWRVGSDIAKEAERLIREAERQTKKSKDKNKRSHGP